MPQTRLSGTIGTGLICLLLFFNLAWAAGNRTDHGWTDNQSMLLFYEALTTMENTALHPEPLQSMVHRAIEAAVRGNDPFADFLSPQEFAAFQRSSSYAGQAGVGMDIAEDSSGNILCIPYPQGPAASAGVRYGDVLYRVDGREVAGMSVYVCGSLLRGPAGTTVRLDLHRAQGKRESRVITREEIRFSSVYVHRLGGLQVITILRFTPRTRDELKAVLTEQSPGTQGWIVDLRGNTGGDLFAAVDCAALFLPLGRTIIKVQTRADTQSFAVTRPPVDASTRLCLWQDGQTASAAEVFVAALTQNQRAVSLGRSSFGKGVTQRVVPLSDGSALVVTYARLIPPNGRSFHRVGLDPTHKLTPAGGPLFEHDPYVQKTEEVFARGF